MATAEQLNQIVGELIAALGRQLSRQEVEQVRSYIDTAEEQLGGRSPSSDQVLEAVFGLSTGGSLDLDTPVAVDPTDITSEFADIGAEARAQRDADLAESVAEQEAIAGSLPEGFEPVAPGQIDSLGRDIVAINAQGVILVQDPVTGKLIEGELSQEDEEEQLPQLLGGLPEGFSVTPGEDIEMLQKLGGPSGLIGRAVWDSMSAPREARYRDGDQVEGFGGLAPERSAQISAALVAAGYLDEETHDTYAGIWTADHARAMATAMTEANINGKTWDRILQDRAKLIEEGGGIEKERGPGRSFVAPAYREPDYATLSQSVKALFRQGVGRDPLDWELALLADEMNQAYRSQYDADVQAQRQQFDVGNHAIEQTEGGDNVFSTAGTVQDVDPQARARERFEELYADELRLNEDRAESLQNIEGVFNSLTSVSRLFGEGR